MLNQVAASVKAAMLSRAEEVRHSTQLLHQAISGESGINDSTGFDFNKKISLPDIPRAEVHSHQRRPSVTNSNVSSSLNGLPRAPDNGSIISYDAVPENQVVKSASNDQNYSIDINNSKSVPLPSSVPSPPVLCQSPTFATSSNKVRNIVTNIKILEEIDDEDLLGVELAQNNLGICNFNS